MICIETGCGAEYEIEPGEKKFFEIKKMPLPKRCKSCRMKRKAAGVVQRPPLVGGMYHQDGGEHGQVDHNPHNHSN